MAFDRSLRRAACALLTAALLVPAWGGLARQVRAASQSEIDALKAEQAESQARQEELKEQLADVKEDQAAARQKRQILAAVRGNQCRAGQHQRADLLL